MSEILYFDKQGHDTDGGGGGDGGPEFAEVIDINKPT